MGALVLGAVVLLVGVFLFLDSSSTVAECGTFLGQIGRGLSSEIAQRCNTANLLRGLGGLAAVGGFLVSLVGIIKFTVKPIPPDA